MPVAREHLGIGAAYRAREQPVFHRSAVDEQILVVGDAAVEGRQAGYPAQPHAFALEIDRDAVLDQRAVGQRGDAAGAILWRVG
jgi:hypothetical protein